MESKVAFGGSNGGFVARWDPDSSSWKTRQILLSGDLETYLGRWPPEGGMRNGSAFQRLRSVPPISAIGSGCWLATPTETANQVEPSMMKWPGCRAWVDSGIPLGGPIPPIWVEWLMGWPLGYTDKSDSNVLGMGRYLEWRRQHSPFCGSD